MSNEKIIFPEPDKVLVEKPSIHKYLKYLTFFGPGAIIASMTIGQGQLIIGPQIGSWAGFALLWLVTINISTYVIAYIGGRFTLLSGLSTMDVFAEKSKKGWMNWLFFLIVLIFLPMFAATIISTLGMTLAWITGIGHYLLWGISFSLLAVILILIGRYKVVEYTQAFFVAVLGIGAIISVILIKPNIAEIIPNFFYIGNVPKYPNWVVSNYPSIAATPIALTMLAYIGTMSVSIIGIVGYLGWIKVKKWGIFKDKNSPLEFSREMFEKFKKNKKIEYLPREKKEISTAKILLKPLVIDLSIACIIVAIVSASYMIAGALLLGPRHLLPSDIDLIKKQGIIFSNIAYWLKPVYQISLFFAFFGTIYAGFEAVSRMLYETAKPISKKINKLSYRKFMIYILAYLLLVAIPLTIITYLTDLSLLILLSVFLLFIGVIGVIFYGIGSIFITQKILPAQYRLGKLGVALAWLAIILMLLPFIFLFIK